MNSENDLRLLDTLLHHFDGSWHFGMQRVNIVLVLVKKGVCVCI